MDPIAVDLLFSLFATGISLQRASAIATLLLGIAGTERSYEAAWCSFFATLFGVVSLNLFGGLAVAAYTLVGGLQGIAPSILRVHQAKVPVLYTVVAVFIVISWILLWAIQQTRPTPCAQCIDANWKKGESAGKV